MVEMSELYSRLAEEVIREHIDLQWIRKSDISIGYVESDREKKSSGGLVLGECFLVKDPWSAYCPHDFVIVVYAPNVAGLKETQLKILLYHELLHVDMDEKRGEPVYRVRPHDVEEFREVINQYGLDWARM